MKTIIVLSNIANKGKSETLRKFAEVLIENYPNLTELFPIPKSVPDHGDFRFVAQVNNIIIGVESQGDPTTNLNKRLFELSDNFKCELILCTSRTRGETTLAAENFASAKGFKLIVTSTYQIKDQNQHEIMNRLKAKHLLNLLQELKLLLNGKMKE